MSTGVVVTHAHRTAVGKSGRGTLRETRPDELLGRLIETFMERVPDLDPADVDDVIVGCAFPEAEQGMNVARIAALRAGLPVSVPGMTLNRFCSSGLQSLATGAAQIGAGWSKVVITGGVESMSLVPMGGQKPAPNPALVESFPASYDSMGITSETVAERYDVSREDQDAFAVESNQTRPRGHPGGSVQGRDHPDRSDPRREAGGLRHRRGPAGEHGRRIEQAPPGLQGERSLHGGELVTDIRRRRDRGVDDPRGRRRIRSDTARRVGHLPGRRGASG